MTILNRKKADKVSKEIYEMVTTRLENSDLTASEGFEATIFLTVVAVHRLAEEATNFEDKEITKEYLKDTFGKIINMSLNPKDIFTMPACDDPQINERIDNTLKDVCQIFDKQKLGMREETLLFRRLLAGLVFRQVSSVKKSDREGVFNSTKQQIEKAFGDGLLAVETGEEIHVDENNILSFPSKNRSQANVLKESKDNG